MSLLPEIVDGVLIDKNPAPKLYTPPAITNTVREEERQHELNNLGRRKVSEDFSDSPHLNI